MPMIDAKTAADRLAEMRANPPSTPTLYKDHDAAWQNAYAYAMGDARSALATLATPALPHDESVGARAPMRESEERIEQGQRPGGRFGGRWHDPDEDPRPEDAA